VKLHYLTLLFYFTLCSCDFSSPISSPEPQIIKEDRKPNENVEKVSEKLIATEPKQSNPRVQNGQDSRKSFDDLQSPLTKGKPRLPFPPENLLD
jgi:hypothetical protein